MGRNRYQIVESQKPHFITCTTVQWLALFGSRLIAAIVLDSLRYMQANKRLEIHAYVIMEHHVHMILSSPRLQKEIGIFKSYTARKIIDYLKEKNATHILELLNYYKLKHKSDREYQLWQEGSHPQAILGEGMMNQKIMYIHYNPVKCGYVDKPEDWRYSSARNYSGMEGVLEIKRL